MGKEFEFRINYDTLSENSALRKMVHRAKRVGDFWSDYIIFWADEDDEDAERYSHDEVCDNVGRGVWIIIQ